MSIILYLNVVVVDFMSEPVSVRRESHDVSVREIGDDKSFSRQRDVHRIGQPGGRIQGPEQIPKRCVNKDGTIWRELKIKENVQQWHDQGNLNVNTLDMTNETFFASPPII